MSRFLTFSLYFFAIFLQSGAYGLTFMLPKLFASFGADEKVVGSMLFITAVITIFSVYFSGHISDKLGRVKALGIACLAIAASLFFYAYSGSVGLGLVSASALLGFGWGLTYTLAPIVLTRMININERIRYFSLQSVFVMAGFGLSPVMASILTQLGFSIADSFKLVAGLCVISAVIFFMLIGPIKQQSQSDDSIKRSSIDFSSVINIYKSTAVLPVIMVCIGASVFAGMSNFQTVFAENRGLKYANFFFYYTVTVIIFRLVLAKFKGGVNPYRTIAKLLFVMFASVVLFIFMPNNSLLYSLVAILFGIGYGVSYPILAAMAANDADEDLLPQTLQLFALTYFIGIFCFPLIAGWLIVEVSSTVLLIIVAIMAFVEASMALRRSIKDNLSSN